MDMNRNTVDRYKSVIPQELKDNPQWICWVRRDKGNGRMDKLPIKPGNSDMASVDKPGTWGNFETAWMAYEAGQAHGVAFVVSDDDPYCCLDLDDCRDDETGEVEPWVFDIVNRLASYTEISPSGRGIHIFVKAQKPGERCKLVKAKHPDNKAKEGKVEIYDSKRFLTVTGNVFNGSPLGIEERQQEIEEIYNQLFGDDLEEKAITPQTVSTTSASTVSDESIIQMASSALNGGKFRRLMDGDTTGYASCSEADLALTGILAFWTRDPEQIFRIVRQSRLYDEKWDRDDYRNRTIQKALQTAVSAKSTSGQDTEKDNSNMEKEANVNETTTLDSIKDMIDQIPENTGKLELPGLLEPALRLIANLNPAEQSAYLNHYIKPRFQLTNKDMDAYEKTIAQLGVDVKDKDEEKPCEMTQEERQEAMEFLMLPDLMKETITDLTRIGIVGEDETKGMLYLAFTSRKSPNPISLELRAPSGVGKSYLLLTSVKLMPEEDVIIMTRITPKYLDYLHEDSLVGKILIITERPGAEAADYSIRMLTDDSSAGITIGCLKKNPETGEHESVEKTVKGPLVYIQTTTRLDANPENESRLFCVYLDEGERQRKAVHDSVKRGCLPHQVSSEAEIDATIKKHRNAQRLLETLPVAIPYAHLIEFPTVGYRSTRDLKRFLSCINSSAFYHQFQRERCEINGRTYIVTSIVDYDIAYRLARKVMLNTLSSLNPSSQELLDAARELMGEKIKKQGGEDTLMTLKFTRKELEQKLGWERYRVLRAIRPLENNGYLNITKYRNSFLYELSQDEESGHTELKGILTPEELKGKIVDSIDFIDESYFCKHTDEKAVAPVAEAATTTQDSGN